MGNTLPSTSDTDFIYGRTTEQIDGVLILKKQSSPKKNMNKWHQWHFVPQGIARNFHTRNKRVKSRLMKSILERDWQKVLIRARLFPREIHEFSVVEVPLPMSSSRKSRRSRGKHTRKRSGKHKSSGPMVVSNCRVKVLPIHVACALRPPPEVVRALLSHAVGSAFSSDRMDIKFSRTFFPRNPMRPQPLSTPTILHHEHNTSFAAVAVQCVENATVAKAIVNKASDLACMVRKTTLHNSTNFGNLMKQSKTNKNDGNEKRGMHRADPGEHNSEDSEHIKDVALFLKQMEDHLAQNGQRQSIFRDTHQSSQNQKSFMVDFDPSALLASPSAVRAMEKQTPKLTLNRLDDDLFSLENSIGDSGSTMTTSTDLLIANNTTGKAKDEDESSCLEFMVDDLSLCSSESSSSLEPPESVSDDSSNDSNSFLQLTVDGKLATAFRNDNVGSGRTNSGPSKTYIKPDDGSNSEVVNARLTFVPKDIRLNPSVLVQSLSQQLNSKRVQDKSKEQSKQSLSRLLPLHIACLYGASAAVLKILSEEYSEALSVEVLGMLPIHMVTANWSLEIHQKRNNGFAGYSGEDFDSKTNKIETLVQCSPSGLWANSSAHGLRPLEYTRILLCYPSNASDESMIRAKRYLDSQEEKYASRWNSHLSVKGFQNSEQGSNVRERDGDAYSYHPIEATSTCTTSGLSSYWLANDSS